MTADAGAKAPMTTIKVPLPLRQRIAGDAADQGVTAAVFLAGLIDRYERERRFADVRRAYAGHHGGIDSDYAAITADWDRLAGADLDATEDDALDDEAGEHSAHDA